MATTPHDYPLVKPDAVEAISAAFLADYHASWLKRRLIIDTSDLTPATLLGTFLARIAPHLSARDLLRLQAVQGQ